MTYSPHAHGRVAPAPIPSQAAVKPAASRPAASSAQPNVLHFTLSTRVQRIYQARGLAVPHRYVLHLPALPSHLKHLLRDVPCGGELGVRSLGHFVPYVAPALPERRTELVSFLVRYQGWMRLRRWQSRLGHGLVGFMIGLLAVWCCG